MTTTMNGRTTTSWRTKRARTTTMMTTTMMTGTTMMTTMTMTMTTSSDPAAHAPGESAPSWHDDVAYARAGPAWIKARAPVGEGHERLAVSCERWACTPSARRRAARTSASAGTAATATFMILGDVCTRACGFCAVKTGLPGKAPDPGRPGASPKRWRAWGCGTP
jgi:hypothetical protein